MPRANIAHVVGNMQPPVAQPMLPVSPGAAPHGDGSRSAASDPGRPDPATCTTMYWRPSCR